MTLAEGKDATKRFCGECKKHVHDLSRMTKGEARALLEGKATEGLCIRYLYDAHGDVVFADDRRLVPASALTRAKRFVTAAAALALPMSLNACMGAYAGPRPAPTAAEAAAEAESKAAQAPAPVATDAADAGPTTPMAK